MGGNGDTELVTQSQLDIICSHIEDNDCNSRPMAIIDVEDLVGRTFNLPDKDCKEDQVTIVEAIKDHEAKTRNNSTNTKLRVHHNKADYEEILTYNDLVDHIQCVDDLGIRRNSWA